MLRENVEYTQIEAFASQNVPEIVKVQRIMRGYLTRRKFNKMMQRKKQIEYLQPSKYFTSEEASETLEQGRKGTKEIESKKHTYRCSGAVYDG